MSMSKSNYDKIISPYKNKQGPKTSYNKNNNFNSNTKIRNNSRMSKRGQ